MRNGWRPTPSPRCASSAMPARSFDLIVVDPPKFAPTAAHAERASRAYKDVNLWALELLRPGGLLDDLFVLARHRRRALPQDRRRRRARRRRRCGGGRPLRPSRPPGRTGVSRGRLPQGPADPQGCVIALPVDAHGTGRRAPHKTRPQPVARCGPVSLGRVDRRSPDRVRNRIRYFGASVASFTHFLTKLDFAAPASFLSEACAVQALPAASVASFMHFLVKLVLAAPASFFSAASRLLAVRVRGERRQRRRRKRLPWQGKSIYSSMFSEGDWFRKRTGSLTEYPPRGTTDCAFQSHDTPVSTATATISRTSETWLSQFGIMHCNMAVGKTLAVPWLSL